MVKQPAVYEAVNTNLTFYFFLHICNFIIPMSVSFVFKMGHFASWWFDDCIFTVFMHMCFNWRLIIGWDFTWRKYPITLSIWPANNLSHFFQS